MAINPALCHPLSTLPVQAIDPNPSNSAAPVPDLSPQSTRLSDLLEQLALTVQCLDHSVPLASPDDLVFETLSRYACLLDTDHNDIPNAHSAWPELDASLTSLFGPESGPLNVKRGVYGVQSVLSFVQRARLHPAWADRDYLLEPLVDRVLRCVVERCTQPQEVAYDPKLVPVAMSGALPNLQFATEDTENQLDQVNMDQNDSSTSHSDHNRLLVSPPNPLNRLIQELQNAAIPSGSLNSRKRHSTTVAHKLEVIDFHNKTGATQKQTATKFGLTQSQLSRWLKEEEELREYVLDNGTASKRQRTGDFPQIEDSLLRFYIEAKTRNLSPSDDVLKERTKSFMKLYQVSDIALKVSNGWLLRFKSRNNIKSFVRPSSPYEMSTNVEAVRNELRSATDSFALKDIYVAGEAGLFCNLAPLTGSLDLDPAERLRLTYLLCTNADGTDKRVPLVVGRLQEHAAFERSSGSGPFWYRYQTQGWMTGPIFAEWLRKFDRDMQRQARRVVLLIETLDGHVYDPEMLACTTVLLVPRGMARQLMPLRAGIVQTFKSNYRRGLMEARGRGEAEEGGGQAGEQQRAIKCGQAAWAQVTSRTIRNCFAHMAVVSGRLVDGLTLAAEQSAGKTHTGQYAADLDMEKSLMATQSALIQLERDMGLKEGSQMTIEQVLELEGESEQLKMEYMPTDAELVAESKFCAAQLQEEVKGRKKEEQQETGSAKSRGGRPKGKARERRQPQATWAPNESFELVPMSVQQIINGLDQIEYSIPFYIDQNKVDDHIERVRKIKRDLRVVLTGPNI